VISKVGFAHAMDLITMVPVELEKDQRQKIWKYQSLNL
jgi:hypothetical protein